MVRKEGPLSMTDVFKLFMWLHYPNLVRADVEQNHLSVRMTYQTGNIVGLVVKSVVTVWNALLRFVGREALSTFLLPYIWYNTETGMYENLMAQD